MTVTARLYVGSVDLVVERYDGAECPSVEALEPLAASEDIAFVTRLIREWHDGSNRFDQPGECFFVASDHDRVVGICGVNIDPYVSEPAVGRLRHLYVHPEYRRRGIAVALVNECRQASSREFVRLRLRTTNPASASLYRSMAFVDINESDATHAWPQ